MTHALKITDVSIAEDRSTRSLRSTPRADRSVFQPEYATCKVSVHNEWDPLEEMIVGVPDFAQVPVPGPDLFAIEYHEHHDDPSQIPSGRYEPRIIEETKEDLAQLVAALEGLGVTVRRPARDDHSRMFGTPDRVHLLEGVYQGTHIDTTVTLLRPGLVLLNPARIKEHQLPEVFRGWDILWAPEMIDTGTTWPYARASIWSGMNFFMVNPDLAVVNGAQKPLIRLLESRGIDTIQVPLRHCRTLSGGLHCVTLDVRRRGVLEDYSK